MATPGTSQITFTLHGRQEFIAEFDARNQKLVDRLSEIVDKSSSQVQSAARARVQTASGKSRSGIIKKISDKRGLSATVKTSKRGGWTEYGTGPIGEATQYEAPEHFRHRAVIGFPRVSKIAAWCKTKAINPARAFVIARSIKQKGGIAAHSYLMPASREAEDPFIEDVKRAVAIYTSNLKV